MGVKKGTLTIYGSGDMFSYVTASYNFVPRPWEDYNNTIEKVIINDGVTSIGEYIFFDYKSLKEVELTDSVSEIGMSAFAWCNSLTSITLPNSVIIVGNGAFFGCENLKQINLGNNVKYILYSAFTGCSSLEEITIPASVRKVGYDIFSGAKHNIQISDMSSFLDPDTTTTIKYYGTGFDEYIQAFPKHIWVNGNVADLENATAQAEITKFSCENNTLKITDSGEMGNYNYALKDYAPWYEHREDTKNIIVQNSITTIGQDAFWGFKNLEQITIPSSVLTIGSHAFASCKSLAQITLPNSVVLIENDAFNACTSLTYITIPTSVEEIGYWAFWVCDALSGITFLGDAPEMRYTDNLLGITNNITITYYGDGFDEYIEKSPQYNWQKG